MLELTYEDKINLYKDRKNRLTISKLVSKYDIKHEGVEYLIRLIDKHGLYILRTSKNKYYSPREKERIINHEFYADKTNEKWYTDVTKFNLREEKCYLSQILDGLIFHSDQRWQ